ncbi:unnamed protein product [Linum trigynum]|uniref:Uncharacterized protein n=1 Tax=Linum trigynum TaxID=586398 RepID=A0AAV2D1M0_9ROSI
MTPPPPPPQLLSAAAIFFILAASTCFPPSSAAAKSNSAGIKGAFVFGSSLVDNGNNNFLAKALAKSNYPPYGIDFAGGVPTGRYTNGKNVVDFITDQLGIPPLPPSRDPSTAGTVRGVDFASGGSGILDETGAITGQVISLNEQIKDFETSTLPELEKLLGCQREELLPDYLFVVGTGGNDYTLNYFLNLTNPRPNLDNFTSNLISSLSAKLLHLRGLGARKFALMAIYPLGCTPSARQRSPGGTTGCIAPLNFAAQLFNTKLKSMVDTLNQQYPDSKFVMIDAYRIIDQILNKPVLAGFSDTVNPCCEATTILCNRGGAACDNRRAYVFFDGLHTTDAVNLQIATRAYGSTCKDDVYPINIGQLAML